MVDVLEREPPVELVRWVETDDKEGVNIIVCDRWGVYFPKESLDQVKFLVDKVNLAHLAAHK